MSFVPHLAAFACMAASADAFVAPAPAPVPTPVRPVHGVRRMAMATSSAARTSSLRYCPPSPHSRAPRPRRPRNLWSRDSLKEAHLASTERLSKPETLKLAVAVAPVH